MKDFSIQAKLYLLGTILIGTGLIAWHLINLEWNTFGLFILATLAAIAQVLKVEGSTDRSSYNISWLAYGFAFVLLGPEAALFVILVAHLVEWAWHKYPWYIQIFNMATYAVAVALANQVYTWVNPGLDPLNLAGTAAIIAALAVFTFINHLLVGLVIWLVRGQNFRQSGVFGFFTLIMDFTLIGLGAATALIWLISPSAAILTVIPLYLIYSTLKVPALQRQTEIDPKTGLFNARYFARTLEQELTRAERFDRPLTVILGDLDLLRNINNTYGHLAGDAVLIGIAQILQEAFRDYDVVARFGGEEFAILLPESSPESSHSRIDEVRNSIETAEFEVSTSVTPIKATISFGIAGREKPGQSANDIIHNADVALYRAKLSGRNCTRLYSGEEVADLFGHSLTEGARHQETLSFKGRSHSYSPYQPNPLREPEPKTRPRENDRPRPTLAPRPAWAVNLFIGLLALTAFSLFLAVFRPDPSIDWIGLTAFAIIVLLTEGLAIDLYVKDSSVSTSAAPLIAGVLLFGLTGALILSTVLAATAMIKHRSKLNRFAFNTSNHLLSTTLCLILILATRTPYAAQPPLVQLSLAIVCAEIAYVTSTLLVSGAISLSTGDSFRALWKERFGWLWPYYIGLGMGAYALIFGYQIAGLLGVVVVLTPLLILRFSQVQYINHTKSLVRQLKTQNFELENRSDEIATLNEELLMALANVIDIRDPYVMGHSQKVARYAVWIAEELRLPEAQVELIRKAGLLHDIGKLGIPEVILFKPDRLTPQEYEQVKQHATLGADLVQSCHTFHNLIPIIRHHHEHYDGSGYPDGLRGKEIPLEARIIGLADALEAMNANRPYRKALTLQEIHQEVIKHSDKQFDPVLVDALLAILTREGKSVLHDQVIDPRSMPEGSPQEKQGRTSESVPLIPGEEKPSRA